MSKKHFLVTVEYEVEADDIFEASKVLNEHLSTVGELAPDQVVSARVAGLSLIPIQMELFSSASGGC